MTDDQWQGLRDEIIGLWGGGNAQILERRLGVWERRFKLEPHGVVVGALKDLERTAKHWPAVSEMHAALDAVRSRLKLARGGQREPERGPAPMSAADWMAGARHLLAGANAHVRRGNPDGNPRHRWLLALAELWERNAAHVRDGEPIEWPPPAMPGAMGPLLAKALGSSEAQNDADRARRRQHLPIEYADEGPSTTP